MRSKYPIHIYLIISTILLISATTKYNQRCDFKSPECVFIPAVKTNFFKGRDNKAIKFIILHYTVSTTLQPAIVTFKDPRKQTSSHYIINRDGKIIQMVRESDTARHAGKLNNSKFSGTSDLNSSAIGIEIINKGYYQGKAANKYSRAQLNALKTLCKYLIKKYKISPFLVLGHSDVAIGRKIDPGPYFPWQELAQDGIGVYPVNLIKTKQYFNMEGGVSHMLQAYGYDVSNLAQAKRAFQLHFNPYAYINNIPFSSKDIAILANLLKLKSAYGKVN